MGLFPHSFVDLKEIPLITRKLTLLIPRQGVNFTAKRIGWKDLAQQPMVLLQSFTTTRAIIEGAFRKRNLALRTEMEASTCMEVKRYVASAIGLGIVHDICVEAEDHARLRTVGMEKLITHPKARMVYHPAKTLTSAEKSLIEFIRLPADLATSYGRALGRVGGSCRRILELRICFGGDISANHPGGFVFRAPQNALERHFAFARILPNQRAWADRTPAWPRSSRF